jgi:hypothetical protein
MSGPAGEFRSGQVVGEGCCGRARVVVGDDANQGRFSLGHCFLSPLERRADVIGLRHVLAVPAESLAELVEARAAKIAARLLSRDRWRHDRVIAGSVRHSRESPHS